MMGDKHSLPPVSVARMGWPRGWELSLVAYLEVGHHNSAVLECPFPEVRAWEVVAQAAEPWPYRQGSGKVRPEARLEDTKMVHCGDEMPRLAESDMVGTDISRWVARHNW